MITQFLSIFFLATLVSLPLLVAVRWLRERSEPGNALRFQRMLFAGIAFSTLGAPLLHYLGSMLVPPLNEPTSAVAATVEFLRFNLLQPTAFENVAHLPVPGVAGLVLAIWLAGAGFMLVMLVHGLRHFGRLAAHGEVIEQHLLPVKVPAHVRVVLSVACHSPFVSGVLNPVIVLPASFYAGNENASCDEQLAAVLLHELAHLENHDTAWLPACRALLALVWPVLPLWLLYRDIALQSELAADALALQGAGKMERRRYARNLINVMKQQSESAPGMPAFALRHKGGIHMRIRNIIESETVVTNSTRRKLMRGAALLLVVPFAGMQAVMASGAEGLAFIAPLASGKLTSTFGERRNPFTGKMDHHNGVDIKAPLGTPILAPAKGTVVFAGEKNDKYGIVVEIQHADGFRTVYAHLQSTALNTGEAVTEGTQIGRVGNSGQSTGPHVHVEVYVNDQRVDPLRYLPLADLSTS